MNMLRLALINFKRQRKSKNNLLMMVIMPIVIVLAMHFGAGGSNKSVDSPKIALCIKDKGSYGAELVERISPKVVENEEKKAMKMLEENEIIAVYIVEKDFSENLREGSKPAIKSYKLQKGNGTDSVELAMNDFIKEKMKSNILLKDGVIDNSKELKNNSLKVETQYKKGLFGGDAKLVLFMIFYFVLMASSSISSELIALRKQKILKRAVTTANKGYEIIGSIYLSLFLIQITYFTIDLIILGQVFKLGRNELLLGAGIIAILSLISISLALVATRICENEGVVNISLVMINIVGLFLATLTQLPQGIINVPKYVLNLAKFTPQYWAVEIVDKGMLFPGIFILILMIVALFTCGNIKSNNYLAK